MSQFSKGTFVLGPEFGSRLRALRKRRGRQPPLLGTTEEFPVFPQSEIYNRQSQMPMAPPPRSFTTKPLPAP